MSTDIQAKVGETLSIVFDFRKELEVPWRDNYQYAVGEFVTIGALVYECTNAGKTGTEIPEGLTKTIAATQADGTVEWTCRDYSTNGSDTIATQTTTASSGISVDSSAIAKSTYVNVTFGADTAGSNTITCTPVTAGGETLKHVANVYIV